MSTGAEIMVALNTLMKDKFDAWGLGQGSSAVHTERTGTSTFFGRGHYWAKKLKVPGKHQKSRECKGNHGKQVKIPEISGTFF